MIKQKEKSRGHARHLSGTSHPSRKLISPLGDSQNSAPVTTGKSIPFNTKGYFSTSQPYAEDYLKAKQQVFKKYRNTNQQLVVIDPKMTKASVYIQRGLLKPNNSCLNEASCNNQKLINNFIKNYMSRKEKREQIQSERYLGPDGPRRRQSQPVIGSTIDSIYPTISVKSTSRPVTKGSHTSRSTFSNKEN